MGGYMGIGHAAYKQDRGTQLAAQGEQFTNLREARANYDKLFPQAQSLTQQGAQGLGTTSDFWRNMLSSRPAATAAVAPETNQIEAQADAVRNAQAALGTSRGGGVAAANQQAETRKQTAINDAIFGARPQAAQQLTQTSQAQSQAGAQQLAQALQALGLSSEIANHLVENALRSRQISFDQSQKIGDQWKQVAAGAITGGLG